MSSIRPALTRRHLITGLGATLAAGLVAGCSPTTSPTPSEAGPWSFTDDLGQRIERPARPVRIVAYGDAAAALVNFGVRPVGMFHYVDPAQDPGFDGIDLTGIEVVGQAYGDISIEALAALQPDLIVTVAYAQATVDDLYGFVDAAQLSTVRQIAPVVAVRQVGSALDVVRSNERLAVALGADVTGGRVAEDRAAFEAASEQVRAAAGRGLTVLPIYAEEAGGIYYAKAPDDPALAFYASLGVRFTEVGGEDYYWHQVSWENADTYDADLILYSVRNSLTPAQLMAKPTFAGLPAAAAGQLHPWRFVPLDYPSLAGYLTELAGWLTDGRRVVGR